MIPCGSAGNDGTKAKDENDMADVGKTKLCFWPDGEKVAEMN